MLQYNDDDDYDDADDDANYCAEHLLMTAPRKK